MLFATPVGAANMQHHDLSSLAAFSEAVIRARAVDGLRDVDVQPFVVLESYRGPLTVEQRIDVQMWAIDFSDGWTEPSGEPADEVVMFLERDTQGKWYVIGSGLRIFIDGKTHRFVQGSNPGPYIPVPQRIDPFDIYGDPRGGEQLDRAAFLALLPERVARAEQFVAACNSPDSPAARDALLEFIGPAVGDDNLDPVTAIDSHGFEDLIASHVLVELNDRGDRTRLLEGLSRIRGGVIDWHLRNALQIRAVDMVAEALDPRRPLHHRIAALAFLRDDVFAGKKVYHQLIKLLAAKEPTLRAHAIAAGPNERDGPPAWQDALVHWSQIESEMRVRYELITAARSGRFDERLQLDDEPQARATRRGRRVELAWASVSNSWLVKSVHIEARGPSGVRTLAVYPDREVSLGGWMGKRSLVVYALFDPPLADGPHDLTVVAAFNRDQDIRRLRLPVRPLGRSAVVWEPPSEAPPLTKRVEKPPEVGTPAGCQCMVRETDWRSAVGILFGLCILRRRV